MKNKRLFSRTFTLWMVLCLLPLHALAAQRLQPVLPTPQYVTRLLRVASDEVGYSEGRKGYTKYGEWSGSPYTQWCAEYLCWCVAQVDIRYGTELLTKVYPLYSGTNSGKNWFIKAGRYIARNGHLQDWGYQWLNGEESFITTGTYIPQPGDWMFFTWDSDTDTDHVAMVEYCTRQDDGSILIHVLEGNNPTSVARNTYPITYTRILGYGTVYEMAGTTMRQGNSGKQVLDLQHKLIKLGLLDDDSATGTYGAKTMQAVTDYQKQIGVKANGIADRVTQQRIDWQLDKMAYDDPSAFVVEDDE